MCVCVCVCVYVVNHTFMRVRKESNTQTYSENSFLFFLILFFCLFAISWAVLMAYGGSQGRGLIGAVAAGPCQSHSNAGSELHL